MVTTEERMKILQMIQDEKISAEEGAKLLSALSSAPKKSRSARVGMSAKSGSPRWLRVRVTDMSSGKAKVNVNLPLRLVDAGLNIAGHFVEDIDFDDIAGTITEALDENMSGKIIDVVDAEDGEHVEIFIE